MADQSSFKAFPNPFLFSSYPIRTALDEHGEAWFCAKDVFEALGLVWSQRGGSLKNTPEKWQGACYLQSPGGTQEAVFISEAAVYQAAFRSRKPEAIRFTEWVCSEVLPTLRKQGYFGVVSQADQVRLTGTLLRLTAALKEERDAFVFAMLLRRLRNLCNLMGEPMPDASLLGQDRNQLQLPGV